jgi:hypothetical protein
MDRIFPALSKSDQNIGIQFFTAIVIFASVREIFNHYRRKKCERKMVKQSLLVPGFSASVAILVILSTQELDFVSIQNYLVCSSHDREDTVVLVVRQLL